MATALPWEPRSFLLDHLPADVCARLAPNLQPMALPTGKVLYESGTTQSHMYFVRSGIVSLLYVTENGESGEIAMVGNEGVVGVALQVDSHTTPTRAVVTAAGDAIALKGEAIDREFKRGGSFQTMILRYTQWLLSQMAQAAICNRHHTIEKQLSRWLLMGFDRLGGAELRVTHEAIANLLGVRREGITEAAGRLQDTGAIRYSRGYIQLQDHAGLERHACECYELLKREYDRLIRPPLPS